MNIEVNNNVSSHSQLDSSDILKSVNGSSIQKNHLNDFATFCMLGKYYLENNQPTMSLFYYSCALKLKQSSSDLWIIVGTLYYATGQSQQANYCLQKAKGLNSSIDISEIKLTAKKITQNKRNNHRFSCIVR
ncbi:MAG: hypothetical protein FK733_04200 [Asgard group archaeon]|nr:hypothetical protein [Asgard group archaeon]